VASHRISDRKLAALDRELNPGKFEREERARLQDLRAATALVSIRNARRAMGRELWFYPTIGAALAAGRPWLSFLCPACEMVAEVDLCFHDRHPDASVQSLIPALSCTRCRPNPPFVRLLQLSEWPAR
jgi:hypothetical protein